MTSAGIEFELTRKRVKNINLRIRPPNGRVMVSAPPQTSETQIAEFVAAKAEAVLKRVRIEGVERYVRMGISSREQQAIADAYRVRI